jgi:mono/diheme cytochrome c family protein
VPSLSEIHGLIVHLPLLAVPVLALLVLLERLGHGGDLVRRSQPWVLGAAAAGSVVAVGSGLLVLGGAQKTLRGGTGKLVWIHLGLGVVLGLALLLLGWLWWRSASRGAQPSFRTRAGIAGVALALVVGVGYVGGKMVYAQGVGVEAGGQFAQTAQGAEVLAAGLATKSDTVALGKQAFQTGLGCGSCHGMQAQGGRGPALAGGIELQWFRNAHGAELFPANVVTDPMFEAVDAYLKTLADHPAAADG